MKQLLLLFLLFTIISCSIPPKDPKIYYINHDFKLIEKNTNPSLGGMYFVIQDTQDTLIYALLSEENWHGCHCGPGSYGMNESLFYIKQPGDILHFEYIKRDRFYKRSLPTEELVY